MSNSPSHKQTLPRELTKAERQEGRQRVELYHQKKLAELMTPICQAIDDFENGRVDAFTLDHIIQVYTSQSKELFRFINNFYASNARLPMLLSLIDLEESGEWLWEPGASPHGDGKTKKQGTNPTAGRP